MDPADQDLVRRQDWRGAIERGAIFFGLERFGAVFGLPNAAIYVRMGGETLGQFQASRNARGAMYSVGSKLQGHEE